MFGKKLQTYTQVEKILKLAASDPYRQKREIAAVLLRETFQAAVSNKGSMGFDKDQSPKEIDLSKSSPRVEHKIKLTGAKCLNASQLKLSVNGTVQLGTVVTISEVDSSTATSTTRKSQLDKLSLFVRDEIVMVSGVQELPSTASDILTAINIQLLNSMSVTLTLRKCMLDET